MSIRNKSRHLRGTIASSGVPEVGGRGIISPWEATLRLVAFMHRDIALRRSRRALLDLTDDQLRDIGKTRDEATREGRRSLYLD